MSTTVSPLAPKTRPDMPAIDGVSIATAAAGIKYKGRTDVMVMTFAEGTEVAGVFTRSRCPSAPVDFCRENLPHGRARILVVNSGNANAFTGRKGRESTAMTADAAAAATSGPANEVYLASTGVIGEPLKAERFTGLIAGMVAEARPDRWHDAGEAIMTTDTYPKYATRTVDFGGVPVTINGIAKGAGMIAPDMATMLSFIVTDADIEAPALQAMLSRHVGSTFNAVTVDSDTSTSDTLLVFATAAAADRGAGRISSASDPRARAFSKALSGLMEDLAIQIVRDGEGARKQVEIT
ncbi:MAG: bifunctional ornithine acetyltransferase/N-acetylglutamate synthase, partial [Notoacmeibacter sp.]|nr:bifunctional ornithine acetyltransferase/N-acetylglutamate synthase [Notoacmeibacter sp.]